MVGKFYSEIAQRISRHYGVLSPGHRKIADFVLKDPAEAACLNNVGLAGRCGVSKATATRFARTIGYDSFASFREAQISVMRMEPSYAHRLSLEIDEGAEPFEVFRNGLDEDLGNITKVRDGLDPNTCNRAVEMILGANRVFAFGAGLSQFTIGVLVHGLEPYCRGNATNIGPMGNGNTAVRRIVHATDEDLLIACSLPNYSSDTIEVIELARDRGAAICCITDRPSSPLAKYSDTVFFADAVRRHLPNTTTSSIAIAEGLVAAVANSREEGLDVHRTLDARSK